MDGAPGPVGDPLKIAVVSNPNFTSINSADQKQIIGSVKSITIIVSTTRNVLNLILLKNTLVIAKGANVLSVELAEISVTVGGEECVINRDLVTPTVSATFINHSVHALCSSIFTHSSGTLLLSS